VALRIFKVLALASKSDESQGGRACHSHLVGDRGCFQSGSSARRTLGDYTQGGKDPGVLESPGRFGALGTAIFFAVLALAMLARAGEGLMRNWRPKVRTVLAWFTTLYLGLNCFLNVFTGPDAERTIFGPISTLTFVFAVITMSTTRRGYRPIE